MKALKTFKSAPLRSPAAAVLLTTFISVPVVGQVVNDGTTNTLNHVTNSISGGVTIGTNGSFTLLILTNGTLLTNSGNGAIGLNATAKSNTVKVTSANTRWFLSQDLSVGSNGAFSHLVITNGGFVANNFGALGIGQTSSNNEAVVTGVGSIWSNRNDLYMGYVGDGNSLVVSNGGQVVNNSGILGVDPLASNNLATVTGSGSLWSNQLSLFIGFSGDGNQVVVTNSGAVYASNRVVIGLNSGSVSNLLLLSSGGRLTNRASGVLGANAGADANAAVLSGSNTLWGLGQTLLVGSNGAMNQLVVSNAGQLISFGGQVGSFIGADSNSVLVADAGSAWRMGFADFELGASSAGNVLVITNGGLLSNSGGAIGGTISGSNNQATVTGTNSVWSNQQELFLGISGSGNRLTVIGGGVLENTSGTVGVSVSGSNNLANLYGGGSLWSNRVDLIVGNAGSGNHLSVDKGATAFARTNVVLGFLPTSSNNSIVVLGGILRTTNAASTSKLDVRRGTNQFVSGTIEADMLLLTNSAGIFEFNGGLLITRGAVISNGLSFTVGMAGPVDTTPAIWDLRAGPGVQSISGSLVIGSNSAFNQLLITNDAVLSQSGNGEIGWGIGANSNSAFLSGGMGAQWQIGTDLHVGVTGAVNRLVISNGALVTSELAGLGSSQSSSNNEVVVTGSGSLWSNISVSVGIQGSGNRLTVSNGGLAHAGSFFFGVLGSSTNNRVIVDGGTLRATNSSASGLLDVRHGTNVLNAGLVEVDRLLVTNLVGASFELNGGTLLTRTTTNDNGRAFNVGNGISTATLNLAGYATHIFANGLTIRSNASLIGNGTISGTLTVQPGGMLAPGNSLGQLSLNNPPVLQGTLLMEISNSGLMLPNDQVAVAGALVYGGALIVTNIGPNPLTAGVEFFLFSANSYSGSFASITLPPLNAGLTWTNKLLVDGSLAVVALSGPQFSSVSRSGTNLIISGTGGTSNATYHILTSTNVALPLTNWTSLLTNRFDGSGNFIFTNAVTLAVPARFYRLSTP